MKRKNYKSGNAIMFVVVLGLAFGLIYLLTNSSVDIGTDFDAEVVDNSCQGREGVEFGMCCSTWNSELNKIEWVKCEDLVSVPETQAFFTFESGSRLERLASVMYAVRVTNEGNIDTTVKIVNVTVQTIAGGDEQSRLEIESNMKKALVGKSALAEKGGFAEFAMTTTNQIRLDIPKGDDKFVMTDGIYKIIIGVQATDEFGNYQDAGSKSVQMVVEQEKYSIVVDVDPIN